MFTHIRKPVRKPHSYRLNLVPLESRDVPATWHVEMLASNPGSTDATITESLIVGTASVTAPTANDAIALAMSGDVIVTYSGQTHTYTFGPTSTSGTGPAFRIVGSGSTTELQLEDLADMPGATPDYDYNDYTWSLNVAQTAANGDPLPEVGIEAIDPTAAEAKSPPGTSTGLFRVSRSGSTTDALTTYVRIETTAGSATNKDDYAELPLVTVTYTNGGGSTTESLYQVTFAPDETYVTISIVPVDDVIPESTESVQLRVVGIDGKYVASTNKYAVAEVLIADNDPFLAPVQKVYFGEGDLVAQSGSNGGMYVIKRTVADSYLTVNYTVTPTPNGPSGFAIGGGYGGSTSATFMPGVSELSVNLTLNGSGPLPGAAKLTLNPSSNYTIMGADSNTVAIFDVGGLEPWINVFRRVDPPGNTLIEGGDKGRFVVSRYFSYPTGQPPETIPPPPPFPDFALGGTARAGLDYTATKQATTVVLPPLGSSMTFIDGYEVEITPLADSVYDDGEWVDFALIPNGQSNVPSSSKGVISVTLPISDTGTPPKPQISIVAPDPNASELATSTGMYRILRNDVNLPQSLTINYAFDPTGLTDPATFNDDYTATSGVGGLASSGSLTFPAGVAMIEVKLTPADDSKLENDELAQLKLLSGSAYVVDATKSKALVRIVDKELKPLGDLDIIDSNGAEVAENKEENPGGWVPVNNDNDDYNFWFDQEVPQTKSLHHIQDLETNGVVVGENDLIKITVHDLAVPQGLIGKFTLAWSSAKINVWKTAEKNDEGAVFSGVDVTVGQVTNYWVEGLGLSSSMAAEEITLKWNDAAAGAVPQVMDKVNFTVYEVTGAMNVPGFSMHKYQVRTPINSGFVAKFVSATSGKIGVMTYAAVNGTPLVTSTNIRWAGGPIVGTYRVTPDMSVNNFFVDREVNVVKVSITTEPGANNQLQYDNTTIQQSGDPRMIISANPAPAMLAELRMTSLEGPVVRGGTRGVRFIEVGFIQNAKFSKKHADYDRFATPRTRFSNVEGNTVWLDTVAPLTPSVSPWYNSTNVNRRSLYYHGIDPATGAVANIDLAMVDTPSQFATDTMPLSIVENGVQVTKSPSRFEIVMDFNAYLAVRTKELNELAAEEVYTQRAKASWKFDGSGDVTDFNGTGDLNDMHWSSTGTKNSGHQLFAEVTSGVVVPVTTGMLTNVAANPPNIVWNTKNK